MIEIFLTNTCPPDFAELKRRSEGFTKFANKVQLDIDDAIFAPVLSWPYGSGQWEELEKMVSGEGLPYSKALYYEAHLMVDRPLDPGLLLAKSGCKRIIPHIESFYDAEETIATLRAYRDAGAEEVGLAVLIDTPLSFLEQMAKHVDVVQLMSIRVLGAQGAPFEPAVIPRIKELHTMYPDLTISIDGGVSASNISMLVQAGARRFGVGSAISKSDDPALAYQQLLSIANAVQ